MADDLSRPANSIGTGRKVVTTAGTAVQLSTTSAVCTTIAIQAETDNTGDIAVGDANVVAADGAERGIILTAGDSTTLAVNNLNLVYIDSTVNGDGVTYLYTKR